MSRRGVVREAFYAGSVARSVGKRVAFAAIRPASPLNYQSSMLLLAQNFFKSAPMRQFCLEGSIR